MWALTQWMAGNSAVKQTSVITSDLGYVFYGGLPACLIVGLRFYKSQLLWTGTGKQCSLLVDAYPKMVSPSYVELYVPCSSEPHAQRYTIYGQYSGLCIDI